MNAERTAQLDLVPDSVWNEIEQRELSTKLRRFAVEIMARHPGFRYANIWWTHGGDISSCRMAFQEGNTCHIVEVDGSADELACYEIRARGEGESLSIPMRLEGGES